MGEASVIVCMYRGRRITSKGSGSLLSCAGVVGIANRVRSLLFEQKKPHNTKHHHIVDHAESQHTNISVVGPFPV